MESSAHVGILTEIIAALSTAVSPRYLLVAALIAAGIALFNKVSPWIATYVPASLILAQTVTTIVKYTVQRPRPPVEEQLVYTYDPSFPSGHSSAAFALATAITIMLMSKTWRVKYPWGMVIVVVVAASASAASRLYLRVHWLSDVLAGAGIGIAAAIIVWMVYRARPWVR